MLKENPRHAKGVLWVLTHVIQALVQFPAKPMSINFTTVFKVSATWNFLFWSGVKDEPRRE